MTLCRVGVLMLLVGCLPAMAGAPTSEALPLESPAVVLARKLLNIPEHELNIGEAALMLSTVKEPDVDVQQGLAQIRELAARVERIVKGSTDPDYRIRVINTVLFRDGGYAYDVVALRELKPLPGSFWRLLKTKKGTCASMPVLWYAVAERLSYPVHGVVAPHHFFLRWEEPGFRSNVETTSGGGEYPDAKIIEDLEVPQEAVASGALMRSLTKREFLAALIDELAGEYSGYLDVGTALALTDLTLKVNPRSIQGHFVQATALTYQAERARSFRNPIITSISAKNESKLSEEIMSRAFEHAHRVTELGSHTPITREDLLQRYIRRDGEAKPVTARPRPFDLAKSLQPNQKPMRVKFQVDPTLYMEAPLDLDVVTRQCGQMCGPGPGNRCAVPGMAGSSGAPMWWRAVR